MPGHRPHEGVIAVVEADGVGRAGLGADAVLGEVDHPGGLLDAVAVRPRHDELAGDRSRVILSVDLDFPRRVRALQPVLERDRVRRGVGSVEPVIRGGRQRLVVRGLPLGAFGRVGGAETVDGDEVLTVSVLDGQRVKAPTADRDGVIVVVDGVDSDNLTIPVAVVAGGQREVIPNQRYRDVGCQPPVRTHAGDRGAELPGAYLREVRSVVRLAGEEVQVCRVRPHGENPRVARVRCPRNPVGLRGFSRRRVVWDFHGEDRL